MKPKNCRLISVVTCSPHHSNIKMDFESMPYLESIKYQQCLIIVVNYDRRECQKYLFIEFTKVYKFHCNFY